MEEFDVRTGILITKDRFDKKTVDGREILYLPAWLALLVQGCSGEVQFHVGENFPPESNGGERL